MNDEVDNDVDLCDMEFEVAVDMDDDASFCCRGVLRGSLCVNPCGTHFSVHIYGLLDVFI